MLVKGRRGKMPDWKEGKGKKSGRGPRRKRHLQLVQAAAAAERLVLARRVLVHERREVFRQSRSRTGRPPARPPLRRPGRPCSHSLPRSHHLVLAPFPSPHLARVLSTLVHVSSRVPSLAVSCSRRSRRRSRQQGDRRGCPALRLLLCSNGGAAWHATAAAAQTSARVGNGERGGKNGKS
jgi:hypothetical protein